MVVLVGKLKARAGQAVHFFLGLLHTGFRLVLAADQIDFSHLKCAIIIQEKPCLEEYC